MTGKLVTVATYNNVPLSEIARLRLENAGIPVRVENADIVNALWHLSSAIGGVRLSVDEEQAPAASALIAEIRESCLLNPDDNLAESPLTCLACGAQFPPDANRCEKCGWSFADGAEPDQTDDAESSDSSLVGAGASLTGESPPKARFAHVRDVGRPFVSLWVAMTIAGVIMGFLTCVLTMLDELFQ
jgi:hypothetical protein